MGTLAGEYPDLGSFTADATLLEIKTIYGLASLEEVRRLGRRRAETARKAANGHAAGRESVGAGEATAAQAMRSAGR